ncbi:Ubiquitin family [Plasmodiophora brassicae]
MKIKVKVKVLNDGSSFKLRIHDTSTVFQLKSALSREVPVSPQFMRLVHDDDELQRNEVTLKEAGVADGDKLRLFVVPGADIDFTERRRANESNTGNYTASFQTGSQPIREEEPGQQEPPATPQPKRTHWLCCR